MSSGNHACESLLAWICWCGFVRRGLFRSGFIRCGFLGVDLLGVDFGVDLFSTTKLPSHCGRMYQQIHLFCSPQNPPPATMLLCGPAAQWPCHCCSCHFSLTCENDRVPSSMITAIRGRQRECALLDGSQVQQHSDYIFVWGKNNDNSHEIHSAKKRPQLNRMARCAGVGAPLSAQAAPLGSRGPVLAQEPWGRQVLSSLQYDKFLLHYSTTTSFITTGRQVC